ncbi:hypothetical protein [uncultured Fibrobacter sp.]|uniref:hypothetical protein n=1 Tax=uncultured Fibrobacter sp. TaxID=261512 RepID=UPI0025E253CF|nr:hypothetical protein [uncultured Fibrobacter sp.]
MDFISKIKTTLDAIFSIQPSSDIIASIPTYLFGILGIISLCIFVPSAILTEILRNSCAIRWITFLSKPPYWEEKDEVHQHPLLTKSFHTQSITDFKSQLNKLRKFAIMHLIHFSLVILSFCIIRICPPPGQLVWIPVTIFTFGGIFLFTPGILEERATGFNTSFVLDKKFGKKVAIMENVASCSFFSIWLWGLLLWLSNPLFEIVSSFFK